MVKKLDAAFSQYVRLRKTNYNGYAPCYTCGSVRHWSEVDAGHFMSRACMSTRWDEQNVQFQCKRCNGFRSGEQYAFARNLDTEYGKGTSEALFRESKKMKRWTKDELYAMYLHYKRLVDDIRDTKGI